MRAIDYIKNVRENTARNHKPLTVPIPTFIKGGYKCLTTPSLWISKTILD